jgi:hypothetical protein
LNGSIENPDLIVQTQLRSDLAEADAALKAHMASWEYAFAMGSGRDGAREHPRHVATHARTSELTVRCRDLRARLAEHEL